MAESDESFKVRAQASRNGSEVLLVSGMALVILVFMIKFKPGPVLLAEIFLLSVALTGIFLGWQKIREPYYSFLINNQDIIYNHRYGYWRIPLENFHSSGIPIVAQGVRSLELNAVGIKLNNWDAFLNNLPPRLASHILVEQRHFVLQAIKGSCHSGSCPDEYLVEDSVYLSPDGKKYTGLLAMFANRMNNLKVMTGYELLIPASVLDRDIWAFSAILNRWKRDPKSTLTGLLSSTR